MSCCLEGRNASEAALVCGVQLRTNPAMVEVSGFTFCYPCAFRHVSEHGCCPVTRFPATVDNVRRLYQSA